MFLRMVEGRFEVWSDHAPPATAVARAFEPGLEDDIARRIKAWASKREKTLPSENAPPPIYVQGAEPA